MAEKDKKARNSERRNGKAWSKSHNATPRVLSNEEQERKTHKDAERVSRTIQHVHGWSITMPTITWEWVERAMVSRWPDTKKVRMVDSVLAMERGKGTSSA